ncbi:MAG TPA: DUF3710 domain-containing protein [Propionibacteriaceae bacterium]|nr:DUF3710 domain-containing protein [Propionibacteriaceae bacterium]
MIFRRKRKSEAEETEPEDAVESTADEDADTDDETDAGAADAEPNWTALDVLDWRTEGPWDISEVDDLEGTDQAPKIDLGSLIVTGVPGSELRLQVAEETQEIVSAMLILETAVESRSGGASRNQTYSSALELGAYAAPRSGGLWAELREEISAAATAQGGSASLREGPFGVELHRFIPVTTPDGDQGYQPSRMWVAEGPRWLLRGIVYGQAAVEEDLESPVVTDVLSAFRQVVVRRGDEAMAPGDLLPLRMPSAVGAGDENA